RHRVERRRAGTAQAARGGDRATDRTGWVGAGLVTVRRGFASGQTLVAEGSATAGRGVGEGTERALSSCPLERFPMEWNRERFHSTLDSCRGGDGRQPARWP